MKKLAKKEKKMKQKLLLFSLVDGGTIFTQRNYIFSQKNDIFSIWLISEWEVKLVPCGICHLVSLSLVDRLLLAFQLR